MRIYATALAVVLSTGAALYPIARTGEITALSIVGAVGLLFLALAVSFRRARSLATPGVMLMALHYALALHAAGSSVDVYSVLFGTGLFMAYEAADLSICLADVAPMTRPALTGRLTTTGGAATAGTFLALTAIPARSMFAGSTLTVATGALCVIGIVGILLRSSRQSPTQRDSGDLYSDGFGQGTLR